MKSRKVKNKESKAAAEVGGNNNGFKKLLNWNYKVLQSEDCVYVIMHLYPEYDYLFLLHNSSGHDKQR
jgi:hypothetical protein